MRFYTKQNDRLNERYEEGRHESGLQVVIIPKAHRKAFALFGTRYGSIHRVFKTPEDEDFVTVPDGIAHFLEHKLFENEDGSDTFAHFAALGASCNAFTSNEMTAYLFSATDHYYENLDVLLRFVTTPYFTPETVQKEMGIIGQEIRMGQDEPFHQLYYGLLDALFVNHNVKVDIAGTEETISHITSDVLYRCYRTFYNLHNMLLVLCGPWDKKEVKRVLNERLSPAKPCRIETRFPSEPRRVNRKKVVKECPVALPLFAVGMKEGDLKKRARPDQILQKQAEHEILSDMLFGKSGAFYNDLYDAGLIGDKFSVEYNLSASYGYLLLFGESRRPETVYRRIRETVKRAGELLSREDFERSRRAVYGRAVKDWNSTTEIAESFMDFAFSGTDMLDYPSAIESVTFEDLLERVKKSYRTDRMVLSVVKPKKEKK
ncbi:MAG: insulinase family protein [Clostridia bacterium]|nr:insulinase family protein [Clostridia bacterium]